MRLVNRGHTQRGHVHTVGTVETLATASATRRAKYNTVTYWCLWRSGEDETAVSSISRPALKPRDAKVLVQSLYVAGEPS